MTTTDGFYSVESFHPNSVAAILFQRLSLCGLGLETSNLIGALPEPILPEIKQEFPPENAFALQRDAQNMDGLWFI